MAAEITKRLREGRPAEKEQAPPFRDLYRQYIKNKHLKSTTEAGYRVEIGGKGT